MKKAVAVLVFSLFALISLSSVQLNFAGAITEVDTTAFISMPTSVETAQAINIKMWIEPSPPTAADHFNSVALTITRPDNVKNDYTPIRDVDGTFYWSYMINQLGNYTFQFSFLGETFADGALKYKSSQSQIVMLKAVGDEKPPVEPSGGSWSMKQPMNQARGGLGVAAVNGKIYAIGGCIENGSYVPLYPTTGLVGTNEEYDPATDTWTLKTSMPTPRSNFAIAVVQNKIYCINSAIIGFKLDEVYHLFEQPIWSGVNEVYDPATDTWETKAPMPAAAPFAKANVVNDKIYIINEGVNWMYDPANDSWSKKASTPTPYDGYPTTYPSAVFGDKIYFLNNHLPVQIYDTVTDSWSQGALSPRLDPKGVVCATTGEFAPERIYFFTLAQYGWVPYGETGTSGFARRTTFVYNPQTDSWSAGTIIPHFRVDYGVAVLSDKVYAIGGYVWENPASNNVTVCGLNEQYTPIGYGEVKPTSDMDSPEAPVNLSNKFEFPSTAMVAAVLASLAVVACLGLFVYYRKRVISKP